MNLVVDKVTKDGGDMLVFYQADDQSVKFNASPAWGQYKSVWTSVARCITRIQPNHSESDVARVLVEELGSALRAQGTGAEVVSGLLGGGKFILDVKHDMSLSFTPIQIVNNTKDSAKKKPSLVLGNITSHFTTKRWGALKPNGEYPPDYPEEIRRQVPIYNLRDKEKRLLIQDCVDWAYQTNHGALVTSAVTNYPHCPWFTEFADGYRCCFQLQGQVHTDPTQGKWRRSADAQERFVKAWLDKCTREGLENAISDIKLLLSWVTSPKWKAILSAPLSEISPALAAATAVNTSSLVQHHEYILPTDVIRHLQSLDAPKQPDSMIDHHHGHGDLTHIQLNNALNELPPSVLQKRTFVEADESGEPTTSNKRLHSNSQVRQ
eukprot:c16418_g1_i2.p1 GENE.c16418_g1_i2~~c16418_g1_i2.p1  ORF type:complete len:413 (+),score=53.84 c16418_g1_i2:105-1241(+)